MPQVHIRNLSDSHLKTHLNSTVFAIIFCLLISLIHFEAGAHSDSNARDENVLKEISAENTAARAAEFLRARPFPQKEKAGLLADARAEDRVELTRLLSTVKTNELLIQSQVGTLTVLSKTGTILTEVAVDPQSGDFILNGRFFRRPKSGSILGALRAHWANSQSKDQAGVFWKLFLPVTLAAKKPEASDDAILPAYIYVEFHDAGAIPAGGHDAETEALKNTSKLHEVIMPNGRNEFAVYAARIFSDTESSVQCEGDRANGIVKLAGSLHRFESRPNGDILITPPFVKGSAVLLKPSRMDFKETSDQIETLMGEFTKDQSIETAMEIVDGPLRRICERLQLLAPNPKAASLCDRAYVKQISIEGRCLRVDAGDARMYCLRERGRFYPSARKVKFERELLEFMKAEAAEILQTAKSVRLSHIIGQKLYLYQCSDQKCENPVRPSIFDRAQPSSGRVDGATKSLLEYRHKKTGDVPLVQYGCNIKNETCGFVVETEAARSLPKEDLEALRKRIPNANRIRYWNETKFLESASALRPLGQCCASKTCQAKLQELTGDKMIFSNSPQGTDKSQRTTK